MWSIIRHSVGLLRRNLGPALGLSVGPLTTLLLFLLITPAVLPTGGAFAISTLLVSWVAVAWHRYVLQEERSGGLVPPFHQRETIRHVMWSFALMLGAAVLLALGISLALTLLRPLALLLGLSKGATALASLLLVLPLTSYLGLRLGLVLPAAALGRPMTVRASWEVTRGSAREILGLAAVGAGTLAAIATVGPTLVGLVLVHGLGHVSGSADLAVWLLLAAVLALGWLCLMLILAALTTLYGHLVERRPLA